MLTLQIVPYADIARLSSVGRIRKLLNITKDDKIVLLQGQLTKHEEAELIKTTMEEINDEFHGIELSVIYPQAKKGQFFESVRTGLANILLGDRQGFTIIGPANIVKEIKKDPDKIQLYTTDSKKKKKKGRK